MGDTDADVLLDGEAEGGDDLEELGLGLEGKQEDSDVVTAFLVSLTAVAGLGGEPLFCLFALGLSYDLGRDDRASGWEVPDGFDMCIYCTIEKVYYCERILGQMIRPRARYPLNTRLPPPSGLDTGIISGVLVVIGSDLGGSPLTTGQEEVIVSATTVGALFGALLAGTLADWWGRKKVCAVTPPLSSLLRGFQFFFSEIWISLGVVVTLDYNPGERLLHPGSRGTGLSERLQGDRLGKDHSGARCRPRESHNFLANPRPHPPPCPFTPREWRVSTPRWGVPHPPLV